MKHSHKNINFHGPGVGLRGKKDQYSTGTFAAASVILPPSPLVTPACMNSPLTFPDTSKASSCLSGSSLHREMSVLLSKEKKMETDPFFSFVSRNPVYFKAVCSLLSLFFNRSASCAGPVIAVPLPSRLPFCTCRQLGIMIGRTGD